MENEKINKEASRASQTRAKDVRKKVWSPPSSLDAPLRRQDFDTVG